MNAWDRQEGETTLFFERFERYRMLGSGRSVDAAWRAEKNKKVGTASSRWHIEARKWHWQARATAWDDHQRSLMRKVEADTLSERRKAWIAQAQAIQGVATGSLLKIQEALNDPDSPSQLSPRDVLAWIAEGTKLELLARGEPTEIHENQNRDLTIEEMSDRDLAKRLTELRSQSAGGITPPPPGS